MLRINNKQIDTILKSTWLPVLVFGIAHILINAVVFSSNVYWGNYSAAGLFYDYASHVFNGEVAYRDFTMEYPPLALVFFLLPRLFGPDFSIYFTGFITEIIIFDLISVLIVSGIARRLQLPHWETLFIYTLALLATGPVLINRYDLIPAVLVLLALYAYVLGRNKLSWFVLALATMTKVYPVVVVPVLLIDLLCRRRYRESFYGVAVFAAVCTVVILPFAVLSPDHFFDFFGYHMLRGLQIESIYSSILLLGHTLGLTSLDINFSYGAWNIVSPLSDLAAAVSPFIVVISLMAVYWFFFKYRRKGSDPPDNGAIIQYSLGATAFFIVTCKVFSPQFIIWLYPLVPLVCGRWRILSWLLYLVIGVLTFYIFPTHYYDLIAFDATVIYITVVRNVLLLGLAVLWLFYKNPSHLNQNEG